MNSSEPIARRPQHRHGRDLKASLARAARRETQQLRQRLRDAGGPAQPLDPGVPDRAVDLPNGGRAD